MVDSEAIADGAPAATAHGRGATPVHGSSMYGGDGEAAARLSVDLPHAVAMDVAVLTGEDDSDTDLPALVPLDLEESMPAAPTEQRRVRRRTDARGADPSAGMESATDQLRLAIEAIARAAMVEAGPGIEHRLREVIVGHRGVQGKGHGRGQG